ncbi:TPA: DUF805 domain-containing protein [Streptococcus suis]|nr:DUF805 domain-containing protein [Streptococcus suis]
MQQKYKIDQRGQNIGFWQAGRDCLRGSFSYGGYTTRKGYFFGGLIISLPGIVLEIFSSIMVMSSVSSMLTNPEASSASFTAGMTLSMLGMVCTFLAIIPGLPSTVRRLRDAGLNNQGIIIFLASSLILSLLPVINIVVFIVNIYVTCQPSGHFLTDEKNHLLFSNREEEQHDNWSTYQSSNYVVENLADAHTGNSAQQTQEVEAAEISQEEYKTTNPITPEIQKDLDEMVMGVSSYASPSDTATRVSAPSSSNGVTEELRNREGIPYSSVYTQKSSAKFKIIGVIVAVILCIAGLSILVTNKQNTTQNSSILPVHKTIDISTYDMVLYSDGESGNGTAEVEITSIPFYEGYDEEIEQFLWNPTVSISKDSGLSNGDVVTVRIELDQDELERLGLDATGIYEQDVMISKLEEPYVAQESSASQHSVLSNAIITNVSATSYLSEPQHNLEHLPKNIIDGDRTSAWVEAVNGQGIQESITLTLDGVYTISKMSIYSGYQLSDDIYYKNSRPARLRLTFSDNSYQEVEVNDQMGEQLITLPQSVDTSSITVTILKTYFGSKYEDTAISDIRFIGQKSQGSVSSSSQSFQAIFQEEWPPSKQDELAQYMVQFGHEMNQPNYQRIAITKPLVWSGRELDENFKILDGYEYWYDNYTKVHRYIFVVNVTGEPVVLYSKDTGDPEFYIVGLTQNEMLPTAFREIYY